MMIPAKDEKVKKMMEYIKGWPRDLTPAEAKKVISYYLEELCDMGIDMLIGKEEVAKVIREGGYDPMEVAKVIREGGYDPMTEARGECKDEKGKHR